MTTPAPEPQPHLIRLQRYLAACGLGSRRACEEFILAGRVSVDGKVVSQLGTRVDPQQQTVSLDAEPLRMERKKYYVLNKPPGVLSTNRDPQGRTLVLDLFGPKEPRLFTVGRLDEDSEGLLIVTNDGYSVTIDGKPYQKGTVKADHTKSPVQSEITVTEGAPAGKKLLQISKIEGDILIACIGPDRPTEFKSKSGSGHSLSVWIRVK